MVANGYYNIDPAVEIDVDRIGGVVPNVDVQLIHYGYRQGVHPAGSRPGTEDFVAVPVQRSQQTFRHLGTTGITGTEKQDFLFGFHCVKFSSIPAESQGQLNNVLCASTILNFGSMSSSDESKFGPLFTQPLEPGSGLTISDLNRYLPAIRKLDAMSGSLEEGVFLADGLAGLRELPDDAVDLIIADPPQSPWEGPELPGKSLTLSEYYQWNQNWLKECRRILKSTGSIYLFCSWRHSGMYQALLSEVLRIQTRITWRHNNDTASGTSRAWENALGDIWFASKTSHFYFRERTPREENYVQRLPTSNLWSDISEGLPTRPGSSADEKPNFILERLIQASTTKLNWVVDPFMRCGETGVTAKQLGRRFIGFEVDRDCLLMAMKRIDQG